MKMVAYVAENAVPIAILIFVDRFCFRPFHHIRQIAFKCDLEGLEIAWDFDMRQHNHLSALRPSSMSMDR